MKSDELDKITQSINEKVGNETAGIIADDIGTLITLNKSTCDEIAKLTEENENLKQRNEQLITSNANLLKQIPVTKESEPKKENSKIDTSFSFMSQFKENGEFI